MKSLRSAGSGTAARAGAEVLVACPGSRARRSAPRGRSRRRGVGAGEGRRVEVGADQALAGRGLLDLGDQAVAAGGDGRARAPRRSRAAARRRAAAPRSIAPAARAALRRGDVLALDARRSGRGRRSCGSGLVGDRDQALERRLRPRRCRSTAAAERRRPRAGRPPCRRPSGPPAALSTTMSRNGPLHAGRARRGSPRRCAPGRRP